MLKRKKEEDLSLKKINNNNMEKLNVPLIISSRKKNLNGRVYSKKILKNILPELCEKANERRLLGELGFGETKGVSLSNVSHLIKNIRIEENVLLGDIEILETDSGEILKSTIDNVVFRPRGLGYVNKRGNISEYEIITFDAIPASEDSFKNIL